ncbi:hypothetical protein BMS3Abin01_01071 [bacterium BMS3Abin01]|nr:hypothetical protein BMS3Abin01_01071 [bacterium BMS3Abin01]
MMVARALTPRISSVLPSASSCITIASAIRDSNDSLTEGIRPPINSYLLNSSRFAASRAVVSPRPAAGITWPVKICPASPCAREIWSSRSSSSGEEAAPVASLRFFSTPAAAAANRPASASPLPKMTS